jgi:hypothetical protein
MFCNAIQKELIVNTCPLPQGGCYWQQLKTNKCKYSEDPTLEEFCSATGKLLPAEDARMAIATKIKTALSK